MSAQIDSLRIGPEKNFTYFIGCPETGEAALVDPSFEFDRVIAWAQSLMPQVKITHLLATHGHWDHAGGFPEMLERLPQALVVANVNEKSRLKEMGVSLTKPVSDNEEFTIGKVKVKALHTPGHTEGGCSYLVDGQCFTGDTLFIGQCGRTDMPGGSDALLFKSLGRLKTLPPKTSVRPGHDYGKTPISTIGDEIKTNPTMGVETLEEFIALP